MVAPSICIVMALFERAGCDGPASEAAHASWALHDVTVTGVWPAECDRDLVQQQHHMSGRKRARTASSTLQTAGVAYNGVQVPFNYWAQRSCLWHCFRSARVTTPSSSCDDGLCGPIQMDSEGWFSVTPQSVADHVANSVVTRYYSSTQAAHVHKATSCSDCRHTSLPSFIRSSARDDCSAASCRPLLSVVELCCGCGGNTAAFLRHPRIGCVLAIDSDMGRLLMTSNNVGVCGISTGAPWPHINLTHTGVRCDSKDTSPDDASMRPGCEPARLTPPFKTLLLMHTDVVSFMACVLAHIPATGSCATLPSHIVPISPRATATSAGDATPDATSTASTSLLTLESIVGVTRRDARTLCLTLACPRRCCTLEVAVDVVFTAPPWGGPDYSARAVCNVATFPFLTSPAAPVVRRILSVSGAACGIAPSARSPVLSGEPHTDSLTAAPEADCDHMTGSELITACSLLSPLQGHYLPRNSVFDSLTTSLASLRSVLDTGDNRGVFVESLRLQGRHNPTAVVLYTN